MANSNILNQIAARNPRSSGVIAGAQGSKYSPSSLSNTTGSNAPFNSITLNSLGSVDIDWLKDDTHNVKKYEVYETSEDILALSVTWHRLRSIITNNVNIVANPFNRPTSLTDEVLFKEMIPEDRERANLIRDYFSKKLMIITLRGAKLSNFRKDLSTFIHGDCKIIKEEIMPLVYRLPEFYDNDIMHDEMFIDFNKQFEDTNDSKLWKGTKTLQPVRKFLVNLKAKKFIEYWLKDDDNKGYRIEIPYENKLNHLWEHFFDKTSIPIQGTYKYSEHDSINYYQLKDWEIDFNQIKNKY